jgi:hypothetical protein
MMSKLWLLAARMLLELARRWAEKMIWSLVQVLAERALLEWSRHWAEKVISANLLRILAEGVLLGLVRCWGEQMAFDLGCWESAKKFRR